jgi:hypothetical protein
MFRIIAPKELREKLPRHSPLLQPKIVPGIQRFKDTENISISPYHTSVEDNLGIKNELTTIYEEFDHQKVTLEWSQYKIAVWNNYRVFHRAVNNTDEKRVMFRSVID